jgi:hypothetical protein
MGRYMNTFGVFSGSLAATLANTSAGIPMRRGANFSLIVDVVTGTSPDVGIVYQVSADNVTFISPTSNAIVTNGSAVSATAMTPVAAPYIRFVTTNNNGAHAVTLRVKFIMQEDV